MNILLIIAISVIECQSYLIPVADNLEYFVPISNIREINASVIYVNDINRTNDALITSLIVGLYSDQPLTIATGEGYKRVKQCQNNRDPNIILITESLSSDDLKRNSFIAIIRSYWSPLYIILTNRSNLTCENGRVSEAFLKIADKYMNAIWQRFRVVRIVISFPYTCPHNFIIFSGKRPSKKTLYNRNLKVITAHNKAELHAAIMENSRLHQLSEGYPLRVNIFDRFPTSIMDCKRINHYIYFNFSYSNGLCGMDAMVMHDFIEHYKYDASVMNDERCNKYGYVEPEFHGATGSLGCVIRNELDISFNSRFQVQYSTEHYFYLHYVSQDSLCVLIKSPNVIPLWHYVHNMINLKTWSLLLFFVTILGLLSWFAALIRKKCKKKMLLHMYVINSITSTLFGFLIKKSKARFRILTGTSLLCSIILLAMFQGNVNYRFTTLSREKEFKTLKQVYESDTVLVTSPSILDLLLNVVNPNDTEQVEFIRKIQIKKDDVGMEVALQENKATLGRGQDAQIEVLLNFTDETGAPQMYVVDQCFHAYYISFIASSSFLFIEESLAFMMRMLEAGLPNKYYIWTRRTLKLGDTYPKTGSEPRPFAKTKMRHLRIAFGILLMGYIISTCVFVVEKYGKRR